MKPKAKRLLHNFRVILQKRSLMRVVLSIQKTVASKSKTPVLDNFGRDLTRAAEEGGRLDPIVGRERELERISQILSRRKKTTQFLLANLVLENRLLPKDLHQELSQEKYRVPFSTNVL